jgi:phage tail-like protein
MSVSTTVNQNIKSQNQSDDVLEMSRLLDYLPAFYREDEFMGRFLLIYESILTPIEQTVDSLPFYFDPKLAPESLLPWLASWMDLVLDESWPLMKRRELVGRAAELYRWRGTRHGLAEYIELYTGVVPEITEYIQGMALDSTSLLGVNTRLGSPGIGYHFTVTIETAANIDTRLIKNIIESQKPAHTTYTLQIRQKTETAGG